MLQNVPGRAVPRYGDYVSFSIDYSSLGLRSLYYVVYIDYYYYLKQPALGRFEDYLYLDPCLGGSEHPASS